MHNITEQQQLASLLLQHLAPYSFALAGSCAIREYGLTTRPTQDIDIFAASTITPELFSRALSTLVPYIEEKGWKINFSRQFPTFAQAILENSDHKFEVDFGIDWRANEPTNMSIGPVISLEDAVASKLSALYSRYFPRDFLDVYNIRINGPYTDEQLLQLAHYRDPGFDREMFANQLE